MRKTLSRLIATISAVALIFFCGTAFASSVTPPAKKTVGKYVFKRTPPTVGSYVRVGGTPNCFEQYSTGDNPGNPIWWVNKKMKVLSVYISCEGVANGSMTIQATLPGSPYNGYTCQWPSDQWSAW